MSGFSTSSGSSTWTPVLTFSTPGDINVVYSQRQGVWSRSGNLITYSFVIVTSTFTYTTAAGNLQVNGLPFTSANVSAQNAYGALEYSGVTKAGHTCIITRVAPAVSFVDFPTSGSGVSTSAIQSADVPSGNTIVLAGSGSYVI